MKVRPMHNRHSLEGRVWSRALGSEARPGILMALTAVIPVCVFLVVPLLGAFFLSLTDFTLFLTDIDFVGIRNYQDAIGDPRFLKALWTTIQYTAEVVPLTIVVGLLLAILVNKPIRGIGMIRTGYYLPTLASLVSIGVIWTSIFESRVTSGFLEFLGLPSGNWLRDPSLALQAIVIITAWKGLGLTMIIYLAGLQGIPREFYEAAEIDGAGRLSLMRHITWPLLKPVTFYLVVTSAITTLQAFDLISVMTEGGPLDSTTTLVYQVYLNAFVFNRMGFASALAFILFGLTLVITIVNVRLLTGEVEYT